MVAQTALLGAWARVATRPRGRLVSMSGAGNSPIIAEPGGEARATARRLATAVNRAAAYGVFRPQCLVRAVALKRLLDARGLEGSRVQVGVRSRHGAFAAHAWVEYGTEVLGDRRDHVETFIRLADLDVLEAR